MDTDAEMIERHGRMLAGLAERAFDLACALQEEALAAQSTAERVALARAFHEVSRSARQSIALELRLRRDAQRLSADVARADGEVRAVRRGQVHYVLHQMIWDEYEMAEALDCQGELGRLIERGAMDEAFVRRPLAEVIAGIEADLRRFAARRYASRQAQEADEAAEAAAADGPLYVHVPEEDWYDPDLPPNARPRRLTYELRRPDSS